MLLLSFSHLTCSDYHQRHLAHRGNRERFYTYFPQDTRILSLSFTIRNSLISSYTPSRLALFSWQVPPVFLLCSNNVNELSFRLCLIPTTRAPCSIPTTRSPCSIPTTRAPSSIPTSRAPCSIYHTITVIVSTSHGRQRISARR